MKLYKCTICGKKYPIQKICSIKINNNDVWIECMKCRGYV